MIPVANQPNGQGGPLAPTPNTAGGVGGPSASAPGGSPKRMRQPRPPQTFAGMQQQGMARPSPQLVQAQASANQLTALNQQMQANAAPQQASTTTDGALAAARQTVDNAAAGRNLDAFRYGGNVQALGAPLMQQVMTLLQDPTQGLNEAAQSNFDRNNRVLGREFSTLRNDLNENMAARGLDASTIAATKLGELGSRQAEAQADLAARIQEKLITDRAGAMNSAIQAAMGLRGQEAGLERDEFTVNRDTGELEFQRGMGVRRLDQDAQQFAQRLALDSELGRGNLALNRDRFAFDQNRDTRDFGYQQSRDAVNDRFRNDEFDWRRQTDQRDFDWRDRTDQRDFGYRQSQDQIRNNQWQQGFDRDGQWRGEDQQYRDRRDTINDGRWQQNFDRDQTWRDQDTQYRDRRDQVGDERFDRTFTEQRNQNQLGNFMGLLQGMGFNNLPPGVLNEIFRSLGITPPGGGSGSAPNMGGGGGGGFGLDDGRLV
ncbi:hypothetical protein [Gemmatimonas sp.]|uniref:hypothetical protein n=1 Tax=Gemmatimonas sp. TaxID=1962908 RepID=UPI0025C4C008|nr:hypothetical protein [Gemmatimonas sp.]MCA2991941.1 hypothetical protein [Gemmatimonas sp.]